MPDFFFVDVNGLRTKIERALTQTIDGIQLKPIYDPHVEDLKKKIAEKVVGKVVSEVGDIVEDRGTRVYFVAEALIRCGVAASAAEMIAVSALGGDANFSLLSRENMNCFCAVLRAGAGGKEGDKLIIQAARWTVQKNGGPLAIQNLDHYLSGSGAPFVEPLGEILEKEPNLAPFIADDIVRTAAKVGWTPASGVDLQGDARDFAAIAKSDKPKWTVKDYELTFGGVDHFFWTVLTSPDARARNAGGPGNKALVRCRVQDPYEWHPNEARNSQCVHGAMERAKKRGAKDFQQVGTADVMIELNPALLVPLP